MGAVKTAKWNSSERPEFFMCRAQVIEPDRRASEMKVSQEMLGGLVEAWRKPSESGLVTLTAAAP